MDIPAYEKPLWKPLVWAALLLWFFTPTLAIVKSRRGSPVIGVLAQEAWFDKRLSKHYRVSSHIAASYVKFVECGGGRVVPIHIGGSRYYYEQLLKQINGVIFPGGALYFNGTYGYGNAGEHIVQIAKEINDNGTYFPLWGTCLGMELIMTKMANNTETRIKCNSRRQSLPLEFTTDYKQSRMFADLSEDLYTVLAKENVTYNYHRFCYLEKSFQEPPLKGNWRILSLNHDRKGLEFVSSIEHVTYPFYGVQFHPEKPIYEFVSKWVPHTIAAVRAGQYFADFFVNEARKNKQAFHSDIELKRSLIYNYNPSYTSMIGSNFEQEYLFGSNLPRKSKGTLHISSLCLIFSIFNIFYFY